MIYVVRGKSAAESVNSLAGGGLPQPDDVPGS